MRTLVALCTIVTMMLALGGTAMATDYFSYGGHTYFLTNVLPWTDAEAAAIAAGGHLVTVNDVNEHNWLVSTFTGQSYWIGFHRPSGNEWVWASGDPVTFTNWVLAEPTGGDEYYVAMNEHMPGGWNDLGAMWWKSGIVEVVPEPASVIILAGLLSAASMRRRRA